jgi:prepilin-type N-terminal cleavage/methylation domain-containing protein
MKLPITTSPRSGNLRGFSLVEVLLAIFILGIGLIMIATIFPVGANWTRQTTEDTIAQSIAQNALAVIKSHYGPGGDMALADFTDPDATKPMGGTKNSVLVGNFAAGYTPFTLQGLPGFVSIPIGERSYQFGSSNPFPVPNANVQNCTYFWTALCRLNPSHYDANSTHNKIRIGSSYTYDIYILVFRKGAWEQDFTLANLPPAYTGGTEVPAMRALPAEKFIPVVVRMTWNKGTYDPSATPSITGCTPPMGAIGIGAESGTVFRQGFDLANNCAVARPLLKGEDPKAGILPKEDILVAPPADNTNASPLIYVYQTTLTL